MYTDRAGQCAAMPGGSGSLESTGTVFKLQCTDPEQPTGKMPPAPKGTVKYELAGTGFSLQQKAEKQPIVSGKISFEIPSERYFSRMRQAEAKYRARRCMPFGSCKESAWEKEQRGEGGWRKGLSVSAARWGFEGAGYIHIPVQKDSARGRFAGQFKRAQPAAYKRQHAHCSGCRCTHCGRPVGARTAKHDAGYLQPHVRQEQKARTAEAGRGDGVIEEKKNSPRNSKGCFGAPDWTRTSGLPGRRTVADRFKWRNRAAFG